MKTNEMALHRMRRYEDFGSRDQSDGATPSDEGPVHLYSPVPGTALYKEMVERGRMLPDIRFCGYPLSVGSTTLISGTRRSQLMIRNNSWIVRSSAILRITVRVYIARARAAGLAALSRIIPALRVRGRLEREMKKLSSA